MKNLFRELFIIEQFVDDGEFDWIVANRVARASTSHSSSGTGVPIQSQLSGVPSYAYDAPTPLESARTDGVMTNVFNV